MVSKNEFPEKAITYYEEKGGKYPWRKSETPKFTLLLTEILLQQTHAKQVENIYDYYRDWTPEKISKMSRSEIKSFLKPLGFSNKRSKWFKEIANQIDEVPRDKEELTELPGVSEYTANAVLCFGFDKRYPIYDTNVERVFNEYFPSEEHDELLWELLPEENYREYNFGLLDLGSELKSSKVDSEDLLR